MVREALESSVTWHWPFVSFLRRIAQGAGLLHAGADSQLRTTRAALDWLRSQGQIEDALRLLTTPKKRGRKPKGDSAATIDAVLARLHL